MLKIILGTFISIFIVVSTIIIFYWRDSKYEPNTIDFVLYFALIPLGISLLLLSPMMISKWYKHRQEQKEKQQLAEQQKQETPEVEDQKSEDVDWIKLNVFSASTLSAMGEDDSNLQALQDHHSAELDKELVNGYGLPILAYRIAEIDDLIEANEEEGTATRQSRIMALLQHQLEKNTEVLWQVAEHLKQSALFYDSHLAQVYRMHPAWIDPNAHVDDDENIERVVEQVTQLNRLNVHLIVAENLLHVWDEVTSTEKIQDYLNELGIIRQQINIEYHYWGQGTVYWEWLNLLKSVQQQEMDVSLMLCVDSDIDQDVIDEKTWMTESYVPAEFVSSCVIAALPMQVINLQNIKSIRIALNEKNILNSLETLQLKQLAQYEQESPFVIVMDDPAEIKMLKKLEQNFSQTPIESYHYLYSKSALGHTQHLSKIFGFMLGLQLPEEMYAMIYSAEYAQTQVFIGTDFANDEINPQI